ncbi:glutathione S-transferase Ure2-like protein [Lipomyces kononenkoae]|uniref:Glutathione S-transferase Ure2-like protein n=1 Tax=Lipomyces kononenkoae TaxID=34357 RepID=A0ACC3SWL2_LIPKO
MSSQIKPIKVWGKHGPNPPKIAIVLEELGLPYEIVDISFADLKEPDYLVINPNGRMPAIYDPNTDLTLWESGAIIEYIIERYDTTLKLSFPPGSAESYLTKQWLFFQVSGQGPYFGQASWFKKFHAEKVPSAIERYVKEINRVTGVLEGHLAQQKVDADSDGPWLVGNKYSYADLSFITWQVIVAKVIAKEDGYTIDDYPHVKEWITKMTSRKQVKAVMGPVLVQ